MRKHRFALAAIAVTTVLLSPTIAAAAPGGGDVGIGVDPTPGGGANIVTQGDYYEAPAPGAAIVATPGTPGTPGAPGVTTAPGNPGLDPTPGTATPGSGETILIQGDSYAKGCGMLNCVPLSPDVGVPATPEVVVDVANLVSSAITAMQLEPPAMCFAPDATERNPASNGVVGVFSWYWICPESIRPSVTGPVYRQIAAPGISLSMSAINTGVLVNAGDGSIPVFCPGVALPFAPYVDAVDVVPIPVLGDMPSPNCGRHIEKASIDQPGGTFTTTASSAWLVNYTAVAGPNLITGVIPVPLTSTYHHRIGEVQVLVTPG